MVLKKLLGHRGRRYPIIRDPSGKTGRQRCFELFEDQVPGDEIARVVGVKASTVATYCKQWKKHRDLDPQVTYLKELLKKDSTVRDQTLDIWANSFKVPREELETIIHQPNGIKRMLTRKIYFPAQKEADEKRFIALQLGLLLADHLVSNDGNFEEVYRSLNELLQKNKRLREEEDEDIRAENKRIAAVRKVLNAAITAERQRRQPDRLSPEEVDGILRREPDARARRNERWYWSAIRKLMDGGLTREQARENMYQDVRQHDDPAEAEALRRYQDSIDPLKPSRKPEQPPSPSEQEHSDQHK